ncbi:MAG: NUDIX domain-containing protein [Candidatus Schekmanbacteria bacterium]|nr:NUDIX domain-containing protein [Candidatus Schekmanbacteria bacterium]
MTTNELFPLVDAAGNVVGSVERRVAHANRTLLHPVVHCLVLNRRGHVLMQKRSTTKDIQPGKWDTSVGGHLCYGEDVLAALRREAAEEIGLRVDDHGVRFLYRYIQRSEVESELVSTFFCCAEGPFVPQASEIDAVRFWTPEEISEHLGSGLFTPNFEDEWARYRRYCEDGA